MLKVRGISVLVITAEFGACARCKSLEMAFITRMLWLRSEDNDSVGLTLLPALFTPLPSTAAKLFSLASQRRPVSENAKACRRGFWSSCDATLCDRPQIQIFSFPLKEPQLQRLVEKLLTQLQLKYFTTWQPAFTCISTFKREPDAWMCLYVNESGACACVCFFKSVFHLLSHFTATYAPPLTPPLKVRPRFTTASDSASLFYFKVSFQAYEKRD